MSGGHYDYVYSKKKDGEAIMNCVLCGKSGVDENHFIESQPGDESGGKGDWKKIHLCEACFIKIEPDLDMWTCQTHYESWNPLIPYDKLPNL
jgi:hypothetical protein